METWIHDNPVAFRLTPICYDGDVGKVATGSVWRNTSGEIYLVSNWHVLSGRNPENGKPRLKSCATPRKIVLHYMKPFPFSRTDIGTSELHIPLIDENGDPTWMQHKEGQRFDIACVRLPHPCPIAEKSILPHDLEDHGLIVFPGIDVFIMGFPQGLALQGGHPVWKRASIAGHHAIFSEGFPVTLVDTATREGMSGSPAFIVQYQNQFRFPSSDEAHEKKYKPYKFVGVYSGRYGVPDDPEREDDLFSAQLGRLWWPHLVSEMIDTPVLGSWIIRE